MICIREDDNSFPNAVMCLCVTCFDVYIHEDNDSTLYSKSSIMSLTCPNYILEVPCGMSCLLHDVYTERQNNSIPIIPFIKIISICVTCYYVYTGR